MNTEAPVGTGIPTGDPRTGSHGVTAADVERWLAELGLDPVARAEREGVASWDIELDGRRRLDLSITLILDPAVALVCWLHFAPPIGDGFRRSYRRLLRWNDEFPFLKFSIAEDERPILASELPVAAGPGGGSAPGAGSDRGAPPVDADVLGLALARMVAVSDRLLEESADWLWIGGRMPADYGRRERRNQAFLDRFSDRVAEFYR